MLFQIVPHPLQHIVHTGNIAKGIAARFNGMGAGMLQSNLKLLGKSAVRYPQRHGKTTVFAQFHFVAQIFQTFKCSNDRLTCFLFLRVGGAHDRHGEMLLVRWRMGFQMPDVCFQVGNHFLFPFDCLGIELNQVILQGVPLAFMVCL